MTSEWLIGRRVGVPTGESMWWFTPLPDITAYELSLCVALLLVVVAERDRGRLPLAGEKPQCEQMLEAMPAGAKRHFALQGEVYGKAINPTS